MLIWLIGLNFTSISPAPIQIYFITGGHLSVLQNQSTYWASQNPFHYARITPTCLKNSLVSFQMYPLRSGFVMEFNLNWMLFCYFIAKSSINSPGYFGWQKNSKDISILWYSPANDLWGWLCCQWSYRWANLISDIRFLDKIFNTWTVQNSDSNSWNVTRIRWRKFLSEC